MAAFIDKYSYLPQTVDIGSDIYFLGPDIYFSEPAKSINLGFKGRKQFLDTFGTNSNSERLLRKYMNLSVKGKNKLVFDPPEDKAALLKILKERASKLKSSKEFTSSTLKNQIFVKSYDNIIKIIQQLEGSNTNIKVDDAACATAKKQVKDIEEDHKFQIILEMAWYLLHPDKVPAEVGCEWAKMIEKLDKLRLGDIVTEIRDTQTNSKIPPNKDAFNYFKKINLQTVAKSATIKNALEQAKKFATEIQDESAIDKVKNRLRLLLNILEMKKYLANNLQVDEDRMKIISSDESNTIKRSMITNPMKGGSGANALNKPLAIAMKPLFDYFKVVYDPIYTFLERSITTYRNDNKNKIIIPQLTTLLHICNNLSSSDKDIYGVYRITNVDPELLNFINNMIKATDKHVTTFGPNNETKNTFNKQLFKLPKVRLSSLSNKTFAPALNNSIYKDPDTLPYIQFFTMGTNINLMAKSIVEETNNAVKDFYKEGNIYMACAESKNMAERIPVNVHDIDYTKVDISDNTIKIDNIPENYFNKNKKTLSDIYLGGLLNIKPYVVYNDAELALSIFIAFKELMPQVE
jgi:hypothetical protein